MQPSQNVILKMLLIFLDFVLFWCNSGFCIGMSGISKCLVHMKSECFPQDRSSRPEVFLGKDVLKICSKFTGEHPCRSVITIKLQSNFIETTLRHESSPVNMLHIFRTPFPKNIFGWLILVKIYKEKFSSL